ncbi:FtsX-like permease family protein [Streptomyces sp. HB132]|uniref:FtsX-like permease family protein n=1 Tax=Streptomyces sp. HB132 TaxID=767388 RepID=UPI001961630E|nr:FtsX-like permease family protein [Streptomyces sp. HB132]MBM7440808.1 putative ABC transport system permease protein [Streptomyces sp. HB132]
MKAAAPWVRTRLRTAPGSAVALSLLVLVTSFLAAAFPRAVDTYEGQGLRHEISSASPERSAIQLTDQPMQHEDSGPRDWADSLQSRQLTEHHREILAALPKPLRADTGQSAYGARILKPVAATDEWLPRLDGGETVFTLVAQAGIAEHSTLASGRLPGAPAGSAIPDADAVEAAVTSATAKSLHIKVGSTIHVPRPDGAALAVRVTGVVEPLRPTLSYWSVEPVLRTPTRLYTAQTIPQPYWHGALLLAPEAAPALLSVAAETEAYWRIAPDPAGVGIADLPRITQAIASLEHGPLQSTLRTAVSPQLQTESGLDGVLVDFDVILSAIGPVVAVAAFGVGSVAGVVLLMAGGLAAARRHAELSLLRSRGGSVRGTAGRLLAEVAVPVLPAAAVGCALALVVVPEGRMPPSLLASAAVALVACAALPLRVVFLHRRPRLHGERDDVVRARPSRRRTVAELTLLVLTVAAVAALRRRGTSDGDVDELVSAAPVLVSVIAALVLVRLYPLPLRLAALPVVRRRGAIGFLSLARAGRSPAATALPLLALLVALTTAAFGGSVLAGVADARDRASLAAVGADARIDSAGALPDTLAGKIRKVAGVRDVVPVRSEYDLDLRDARTESVTLLAVDPDSYARLARSTGLGAFRADELRKSSGVLPALASPAVAERLRGRTNAIGPAGGLFTVRVDVVRSATPAVAEGDFLVVDAGGLPGSHRATTLLISGPSVAGAGLEAATRTAGSATVTLRSAERDGFTESPVQSGAERIYVVAAVAGAGYAVLALLLSLLRTAPERSALLSRLRTMGLTRRQGRRLLILENLPQALLAAVGGALVGWTAIRLLAPGIDLGHLALATQGGSTSLGPVQLRADPVSLLLPSLAVVVIASAVAAAQARVATRRTATTELRAGDMR